MAGPSIYLKFFKPLDVPPDDLPQFSFRSNVFFDKVLYFIYLLGSQTLGALARVDIRRADDLSARAGSDPVKIRKGDIDPLMIWYVDA